MFVVNEPASSQASLYKQSLNSKFLLFSISKHSKIQDISVHSILSTIYSLIVRGGRRGNGKFQAEKNDVIGNNENNYLVVKFKLMFITKKPFNVMH